MKKLILIALVAVSAVSCQKEQTQTKKSKIPIHNVEIPLPCTDLDKKHFFGKWKYIYSQSASCLTPIFNEPNVFQTINITFDSLKYTDVPVLTFKWDDMGCSIVRGFNQPEDLRVTFPPNDDWHMYLKGLTTGTIWYLEKQYQ